MNDLAEILLLIKLHHGDNPDHGINCACMDKYIGQLRHLFKVDDLRMQQRVDNVVRLALER